MTQQTNQTPKEFPLHCSKSKLVEMYISQMSEADILRQINEIIRENRKLPKGSPVYKQRIWHRELREFVQLNDVAIGYHLPSNFNLKP